MFLLDGTEEDLGVDHDSIEVTVNSGHTLHGTRTPQEWLSFCGTDCCWRSGGDLRTGGHHCIGGQAGGNLPSKVLLDVDWTRCGLAGGGLRAGISRDRTSNIIIIYFLFFH